MFSGAFEANDARRSHTNYAFYLFTFYFYLFYYLFESLDDRHIFNPVTFQSTFSDFSKEQYDKQHIISNPSSKIDYRIQINHSTQYTS